MSRFSSTELEDLEVYEDNRSFAGDKRAECRLDVPQSCRGGGSVKGEVLINVVECPYHVASIRLYFHGDQFVKCGKPKSLRFLEQNGVIHADNHHLVLPPGLHRFAFSLPDVPWNAPPTMDHNNVRVIYRLGVGVEGCEESASVLRDEVEIDVEQGDDALGYTPRNLQASVRKRFLLFRGEVKMDVSVEEDILRGEETNIAIAVTNRLNCELKAVKVQLVQVVTAPSMCRSKSHSKVLRAEGRAPSRWSKEAYTVRFVVPYEICPTIPPWSAHCVGVQYKLLVDCNTGMLKRNVRLELPVIIKTPLEAAS